MQLEGQVVVITGGTRGIGYGIASAFVTQGARVVLSGRSREKGKQALAELNVGGQARFHACDVRDADQLHDLINHTARDLGRIDVLVNNAGGSDGFAPVHEMTDAAWQNALDWNLNSTFRATRSVVPHMLATGYGRIINISSTEGKHANKPAVSHYITNKHAINGFTKAVAFEYGLRGITCNAICPGAVETDIMREAGPLVAQAEGITYGQFLDTYRACSKTGQLNTVEEVAAMALLLAGPHSAGINGALLNVDGGTAEW